MSEPSEATHYQIELTSGQVLVALATVLVCLLASFFAGVWLGRVSSGTGDERRIPAAEDFAGAEGSYDFFARTRPLTLEEAPANGAEQPSPDDGRLREPDMERDRAARSQRRRLDERSRPSQAPSEDPARPRTSAAAREETAEEELPPPRVMEPLPAKQSAAEAASASTEGALPPPGGEAPGFYIQVLASSDRDRAQAFVDRLVDADFEAFLSPVVEEGREVYRVRVGPLPDRDIAQRRAEELERRWSLETWISPGAP